MILFISFFASFFVIFIFNTIFSLKKIIQELKKLLRKDVIFLENTIGDQTKEACSNLQNGEVALLENLRFYEEETKADIKLSKYDKRTEYKVLDYIKQVEHGPKKYIKP